MDLVNYENYSREDLLEKIQTLQGKLGIQQKRGERLNNEFKRQERRLLTENRKLKTALRALGGNAKGGIENYEALRKENQMLRATIKTYHDELRKSDPAKEGETSSQGLQQSKRRSKRGEKKKRNRRLKSACAVERICYQNGRTNEKRN